MSSPKLTLKNITAICVDGRAPNEITQDLYTKILRYMRLKIEFGAIKLLSREDPQVEGVQFFEIPRMSRTAYSAFCLKNLSEYVSTDFCLVFQSDGFVLNPEFWTDEFLSYDYIGAPWPSYLEFGPAEGQQVGNGGFSLRSKRLLEVVKTIDYSETRYRPSNPPHPEIALGKDAEPPPTRTLSSANTSARSLKLRG